MKILLTGKNGQVGHELQCSLAPLGEVVAVDAEDCDLSQPDQIRALVARVAPGLIVNPAAYTAVDKAESEPELAHAVNAQAPGVLAAEANRLGIPMIHYSTDYVFDGTRDGWYVETDATHPQSVYGASKCLGEEAVRAAHPQHVILRTSWVFGAHGGNFLKTMLRLARERDSLRIVADQVGAPTSAAFLAAATAQIVAALQAAGDEADALYGTYHLVTAGETSWHGYARHVVALAQAQGLATRAGPADIEPIPTAAYPLPAPRPANSRLDTTKLRTTFGIAIPSWEDEVARVVAQVVAQPQAGAAG